MNERIKELKEQARDFYLNQEDLDWSPQELHNAVEAKFAELIVRECAEVCDLLLDHKISSEWSRGTHDCSKAIKKHFGVEE